MSFELSMLDKLGKTVFLTRAEAKAAIAKEANHDGR
jgi:hypothetical protein